MKKKIYIVACCIMATVVACTNSSTNKENEQPPITAVDSMIKRGEYLVATIGCGDCHTPKIMTEKGPAPNMDRFLSGYNASVPLGEYDTTLANSGRWALFYGDLTAAAGPWGLTFASNLTPDPTGLGNWTYDNFRKVMKEGKYKGIDNSRPIMPPMPWQNFANLSEEDLKSIFEYLKTIKPINNLVPQAHLNPPPPAPKQS